VAKRGRMAAAAAEDVAPVADTHGLPSVAKDINEPSEAWKRMAAKWDLTDALIGGTMSMRAARTKWLPQEKGESNEAYDERILRTTLYNGFRDSVNGLTARPFTRNVALKNAESIPEQLKLIEDDADSERSSLTQFARAALCDAIHRGVGHILVDAPAIVASNFAEERTLGLHPYFAFVSARDLIGWKAERGPGGRRRLTEIRIREPALVPDGDFGEKSVTRVRLLRRIDDRVVWGLYESSADAMGGDASMWNWIDGGPYSEQVNEIPLLSFYLTRTDFMEASPPLEDLAWLNLTHWQSSSDQRNSLHRARVPMLFESGTAVGDIDKPLTLGSGRVIRNTNPDANLRWVEHSGSAIGAGRQDLQDLQIDMKAMGDQPMVAKPNATATGDIIGESRSSADLQSWVRAEERALRQAYDVAAKFVGGTIPDDFAVDIFDDFALPAKAGQEIDKILVARQQRVICHATALAELKRRDLLAADLDVAAEMEACADEAPPMGSFGFPGPFGGPADGGGDDKGDDAKADAEAA